MRSLLRAVHTLLIAIAAASFPANAATVAEMGWLAGCWASENGESGSGEQWMAPAGGTLLGMGRTVKSGKTVAHEFMEIRELEPGKLGFVAHPSGQPTNNFPLASLKGTVAVFEDPEHDFPQRVVYRLEPDGLLRARIEGVRDGKLVGVDFPMERVSCEPTAVPGGN